jgi:DNA-binding CsgD family transcriptional regulator
MPKNDFTAVSSLFYEGVMCPETWTTALGQLAAVTASSAVTLLLWDRNTDQALVGEHINLPAELLAEYAAYYHQFDMGREVVDRLQLGEWYVDERDIGATRMSHSPFYQEFLRRYELDSTMSMPVFRTGQGINGFLTLSSPAGRRDQLQVARDLQPLLPHLQQAVRLRHRFMQLSQQAELQANILDTMQSPLLVANASGHFRAANKLGEQWLARHGSPLINGGHTSPAMKAMLMDACGAHGHYKAGGTPFTKADGTACLLTAVPLAERSGAAWGNQEPLALLVIHDASTYQPPAADLLKQMFGLTPAEIRLSHQLLQGSTLKEAAEQLHISTETGRSHLKSIFVKLGVRRQSDMLRILGQLS